MNPSGDELSRPTTPPGGSVVQSSPANVELTARFIAQRYDADLAEFEEDLVLALCGRIVQKRWVAHQASGEHLLATMTDILTLQRSVARSGALAQVERLEDRELKAHIQHAIVPLSQLAWRADDVLGGRFGLSVFRQLTAEDPQPARETPLVSLVRESRLPAILARVGSIMERVLDQGVAEEEGDPKPEVLSGMLKDFLLRPTFSNFLVARRRFAGRDVALDQNMGTLDRELRGLVARCYRLEPQDVPVGCSFSGECYIRAHSVSPEQRPGTAVGSIAEVTQWGFVDSNTDKIVLKSEVVVVDEPSH